MKMKKGKKLKETSYRNSTKKHRAKDFKRKGKEGKMEVKDITR